MRQFGDFFIIRRIVGHMTGEVSSAKAVVGYLPCETPRGLPSLLPLGIVYLVSTVHPILSIYNKNKTYFDNYQ